MSERVVRSYRGMALVTRGGGYALYSDGELLATTDSPAVADKLFFKLALEAAGKAAKNAGGTVGFTPAGKRVFFAEQATKAEEPAGVDAKAEKTEKPEKEKKPRTVFRKPTVEEVAAYCAKRGNTVDAEAFIDHYQSKGWTVGRAPMKDWKAAVRTWERKEKTLPPYRRHDPRATNPPESSLDIAGYERELLRWRPAIKGGKDHGPVDGAGGNVSDGPAASCRPA